MRTSFATLVVLVACGSAAWAGDWPMWRYDAARSAATPEGIATNLTLLWSRQLPPVRPAWPLEPNQRINFDASYEPVVMGQRLFLGSPNDGSVTAYDTETGEEKWKFYTEGPVRCAPACAKGKVYVGSDDGYLYCLKAEDGAVVWKFRGAPAERPDRRQLGNGHLVSFWPVRGGPVVVNGVVYFGAGIWPIFGVFLHAVDAETGQVRWSNGALNYIAQVRIDHEFIRDVGLSPQGHLVVMRNRLIVPCGRSTPAGLDLATGKLVYYVQGHRNGDSRVAAHGDYAFVGKNAITDLYDFREVGSKWARAGTNAPPGYASNKGDLNEAPFLPYKVAEACDAASAFDNGVAYGALNGTFYAYDVAHAKTTEADQDWGGSQLHLLKWQPPVLWRYPTSQAGQPGSGVIKAGTRLYGHAGRKLLALDDLNGRPRLAWAQDLDGTPSSLVAAADKLFVATLEGGLYCFGAGPTGKTYVAQTPPPDAKPDGWTDKARQIVKATGVKAGYALVLGLTDGRLVAELLKQTDLSILAVDADAQKIESLRRRYAAAGLLGARVELFTARPFEFLLPPYLASLIVSEDAAAAGFSTRLDAGKLFNLLRPYGGTLCLELPSDERPHFEGWTKAAGLAGAAVKQQGGWSLLVRAGALPGSAPWTHEWGDAGRTFCSQDDVVKAPLGILWYGDGNGFTQFHDYGSGIKAEVAGGRVFATQRHSNRIALFSYDAYTGRPLWTNELRCFSSHARVVSLPDAVYLAADGKCFVYDAATGQRLSTFTFMTNAAPSNSTQATAVKDLRVDGDTLLILCGDVTEQEIKKDEVAYWNYGLYAGKTLVCLDRKTGAERWRREAQVVFHAGALALGGGRVFVADAVPFLDPNKEQWKAGETNESAILALDARSGRECWRKTLYYQGPTNWWRGTDSLAYAPQRGTLLCGKNGIMNALDGESGKTIWENTPFPHATAIVGEKAMIDWSGGRYDLATGKPLPGINSDRGPDCCNYPIGSTHLVTMRESTASFTDIDNNKRYYMRNLRSGCSNSLIPADGLVNSPNYSYGCICNYAIQTSFAMVCMPDVAAWSGAAPLAMTPPGTSAPAAQPGGE